jgi:hypothetical protein
LDVAIFGTVHSTYVIKDGLNRPLDGGLLKQTLDHSSYQTNPRADSAQRHTTTAWALTGRTSSLRTEAGERLIRAFLGRKSGISPELEPLVLAETRDRHVARL